MPELRTEPMQNPPLGDCSLLPKQHPLIGGLSPNENAIVEPLMAAIFKAQAWVGVSLMDIAERTTEPGQMNPSILHPAAWASLNYLANPTLNASQIAAEGGWVIVEDGYAYPTQQLVDLLLAP